MGRRGRFGKYGDSKRTAGLRRARMERNLAGRALKAPGAPPTRPRRHLVEPSVSLREAGPQDLSPIRELSGTAFEPYGSYAETLSRWFLAPFTLTLVAHQGAELAGFAMLGLPSEVHRMPPTAELLAIAVAPAYRRRGIGGRLLRTLLKQARRLGVQRVILHTAVENAPAQRLFGRHGFSAGRCKPAFYPAGQDAIMMCRVLAASAGMAR